MKLVHKVQRKVIKYKWFVSIFAFSAILVTYAAATGIDSLGMAKGSSNTCTDSDGGNVPTVFGTVHGKYKNKAYSYSDTCVSSGVIKEYYCSGKYQTSVQQSCGTDGYIGSNYCIGGNVYRDFRDYYCANGSCRSSVTPTIQQVCDYGCANGACNPASQNNTCSDTDGGYWFTVQGTVSGYYSGYPYSYTDSCNSTMILNEWVCYGTSPQIYQYACSMNYTSCLNGACI